MTYYTRNSTNGPTLRQYGRQLSTMATATKILPKQPSTKLTMYNLMPTCTQMEDILSCKERLSLGLLSCFAFFLDHVTDLRYLFCYVLKSCLRINWIPKIIFYFYCSGKTHDQNGRSEWSHGCCCCFFLILILIIIIIFFNANRVVISVVKVRWNRHQKRATCFETLLQSELLRVLPPNNQT